MSDPNIDPNPGPAEPLYPVFPEQDEWSDNADTAADARSPRTVRGAAILGARVLTGAIGVVVAVAVVVTAGIAPLPSLRSTAPSTVVTPVATAQELVCPGSLLRLASDTGKGATTASSIGVPTVRSAVTFGNVTSKAFADSEANTGGTSAAPQVLTTPPNDADPTTPTLISGAESQNANNGEFIGLAATSCTVASGDQWLVGGSTVTGRTTLLTLSNPTEVAATVDIAIMDEDGPVVSPGMTGIVVAPNGQRVLSLAGFAPEVASPVVHVSSRGGQVVASLQQSIVRGLAPGGVDIVTAGAAPAKTAVIPGVVLTNTVGVNQKIGADGFDDLVTVIRVASLGTENGSARVSVVPEDGKTTGKSFDLPLTAGSVTDFPLDELADGNYAVTVTADDNIVASVRSSTSGVKSSKNRTDFAWLSSATQLTSDALVTVASGIVPALHFTNPTDAKVTITATPVSGTGTKLSVPIAAGSSARIPAVAGTSYRISGFEQLYASVSARTNGGVSGYGVIPSAPASSPVRIYP